LVRPGAGAVEFGEFRLDVHHGDAEEVDVPQTNKIYTPNAPQPDATRRVDTTVMDSTLR